jgi:protein-L-isoaspartate(D-aspartate) O-methyltransferase
LALDESRERFQRLLASEPGVTDERVPAAFSRVPREQFVGVGPWLILEGDGYVESPSADLASLYDDVVVALKPGKRINNGQPTLHARCLSAARVRPAEKVLHIGCGSGYYTAVLSELVGPRGEVLAWDIEADLAAAASANLAKRAGVSVAQRDATEGRIPLRDVIYVCAGCTHPVRTWAEALSEGGRLLFPLTPGWGIGAMLMVTRAGDRFDARFVGQCSFIPCAGASDVLEEAAVRRAFDDGGSASVTSLHFGDIPGDVNAWLGGDGWWLQ